MYMCTINYDEYDRFHSMHTRTRYPLTNTITVYHIHNYPIQPKARRAGAQNAAARGADHSILVRENRAQVRHQWAHTSPRSIVLTRASPTPPCEPDGGLVYSGTLSGMQARLYLNSMVAFSAALSAAPRWNEPAWVGVSKGLEVRLAGRGHCWRWLTCWRLDDGRLDWQVGALLRRDGGAPQPLPARAGARRDRAPSGWLGCVHWAYRQSAWAPRRGRAVGGGCKRHAGSWRAFL